jgi:hypothetical protein
MTSQKMVFFIDTKRVYKHAFTSQGFKQTVGQSRQSLKLEYTKFSTSNGADKSKISFLHCRLVYNTDNKSLLYLHTPYHTRARLGQKVIFGTHSSHLCMGKIPQLQIFTLSGKKQPGAKHTHLSCEVPP